MRKTKRILADFAFFDRTGIQNFLEKQAKKGWKLKKVQGSSWYFEYIEPRNIHYSVNYFSEAALMDEEPSQGQMMYQDLCEYSGWTRIETFGPMQIFCSELADPLPVETDPLIEMETIHKSTKKVYLRPRINYLIIGAIYLLLYLWRFSIDPISTQNDKYYLAMALFGLGWMLWSLFELLQYYFWQKKARRAAQMGGGFVDTKSYPYVSWIILSGFVIPMLILMIEELGAVAIYIIIAVLIYTGAVIAIRSVLGMKSEKSRTLQLVFLMLCFLVICAFFALVLMGVFLPIFQGIYS